jgi:hypothetical protein
MTGNTATLATIAGFLFCAASATSAVAAHPPIASPYDPHIVHLVSPKLPAFFTLKVEKGIPYNPESVSESDKRWLFGATAQRQIVGPVVTFINRSSVAIPIKVDSDLGFGSSTPVTHIPPHSTASFRFKSKFLIASFTFAIYEQAAFIPRGPH